MAIVETRYLAPGWGVGELWMRNRVILAHDFDFTTVSDTAPTSPIDMSTADTAEAALAHGRKPHSGLDLIRAEIGADSSHVRLDRERCLTPEEADALAARFRAFLEGANESFGDVEIDLSWATPLQRALVEALRAVPRGEVVSYGELAELAGRPGASRAAGAVCSGNRFSFIVPCHRVVSATGIGGYGSAGVEVKRRLLALEGIEL